MVPEVFTGSLAFGSLPLFKFRLYELWSLRRGSHGHRRGVDHFPRNQAALRYLK